MLVTLLVTVLGGAVIAFYVQFLFALCKESKPKPHVDGYWLRLRLKSHVDQVSEREEQTIRGSRAA